MDIAFLGTGLMGEPMAERLVVDGHKVTVYNRTQSKTKSLKEKGAIIAGSAQKAVEASECVILMLADSRAIEEVLFRETLQSLDNKMIIQMGTIAPSQSIEIQKKVFTQGGEYFECPVLGSRKEAREGTLILMVGATEDKFIKWQDFLKSFGPHPRLIGEVGKAATLKLALNHLIASHAVAYSLSLGLVQKSEINEEIYMDILRESALYASMSDKKLPNWQKRNYMTTNFPVKHLLKDIELIQREAKEKDLSTEGIDAVGKLLKKTMELGLEEQDYSAVYEAINKK